MVHGLRYSSLSASFGISHSTISKILDEVLPILYDYFQQFISNEIQNLDSIPKSILSDSITCIIDGTIHFVDRHPFSKYSRADKKGKFIQTIYLINFNGEIIAFETNIPGHLSDNAIPKRSTLFHRIMGEYYALADTGFNNIKYVTAGFKANQLKTSNQIYWDIHSRKEQKKIEHVNSWIKKFKCLKHAEFISEKHLIYIVMIASGLLNFKKFYS